MRDTMSVASTIETRGISPFRLEDDVFARDVSHVREILEFIAMTKVLRTPE